MARLQLIEKINELLAIGIHVAIPVATYIYTNYPKLIQEKSTGLSIRIETLSDDVLKKIIEIANESITEEIPFYLTLM
jgi:hypothetical protein